MHKLQEVALQMKTLAVLSTPGFVEDLPMAFGKTWELVEAFKIERETLFILSSHPALHWAARIRKKEILDGLKIYGINKLCLKRIL